MSHTPPQSVADTAAKGLRLRAAQPSSRRGGTAVGIARARDLANRRPVSDATLARMRSYFARHAVDSSAPGWGVDSKGWQAWLLWGGNAGREWALRHTRSSQPLSVSAKIVGQGGTSRRNPLERQGENRTMNGAQIDLDNYKQGRRFVVFASPGKRYAYTDEAHEAAAEANSLGKNAFAMKLLDLGRRLERLGSNAGEHVADALRSGPGDDLVRQNPPRPRAPAPQQMDLFAAPVVAAPVVVPAHDPEIVENELTERPKKPIYGNLWFDNLPWPQFFQRTDDPERLWETGSDFLLYRTVVGDRLSRCICIPEQEWDKFGQRLAALVKSAKRCGVAVNVTESAPFSTEWLWTTYRDDRDYQGTPHRLKCLAKMVQIDAPAIKIAGWEGIAKVDHQRVEGGWVNLQFRFSKAEYDVGKWATAAPNCDHCNLLRHRNSTVLIKSGGGVVKQVGMDCLRDYTGHDWTKLISWGSMLSAFDEDCEEMGRAGALRVRSTIREAMELCAKHLETSPFVSKRAAEELHKASTAEDVEFMLALRRRGPAKNTPAEQESVTTTEVHEQLVEDAITWVHELQAKSDYEFNLKGIAAMADGILKSRHVGFACAMIAGYNRWVENGKVERATRTKAIDPGPVGAVGDRVTVQVTQISTRVFTSFYGETVLHKWVEPDTGRKLSAFHGGRAFSDENGRDLVDGATGWVTGTVKEHKEFNGVSETQLTRCAWSNTEPVKKEPKAKKARKNPQEADTWWDQLDDHANPDEWPAPVSFMGYRQNPAPAARAPAPFQHWRVTGTTQAADHGTYARATHYDVISPEGKRGSLVPTHGAYRFIEQLAFFDPMEGFALTAEVAKKPAARTLFEPEPQQMGFRFNPGCLPRKNPRMKMSDREARKPLIDYKHWSEAWFREILQNSVDAQATRVEFTIENRRGVVTVRATDNGNGMTTDVLLNKFLVLGATGKEGVAGATGGFGEAKKLLLWPWQAWAIVTSDHYSEVSAAVGKSDEFDFYRGNTDWRTKKDGSYGYTIEFGKPIKIEDNDDGSLKATDATTRKTVPAPARLALEDLIDHSPHYHGTTVWIQCSPEEYPSEPSLIAYISKCDLSVEVFLNGKKLKADNDTIDGAEDISHKVYDPGPLYYRKGTGASDSKGTLLIQAGKQGNWMCMWSESLGVDADLIMRVPGWKTKEVFTSNRDGWRDSRGWYLDNFVQQLTVDPITATRKPLKFNKLFLAENAPHTVPADPVEREAFIMRLKQEGGAGALIARMLDQTAEESEMASEVVAATPQAAKQFNWAPPIALSNELEDWNPGEDWYPGTMSKRHEAILKAWSAALRACCIQICEYGHEWGIGLVASNRVLGQCGQIDGFSGSMYWINPYIHESEMTKAERATTAFEPSIDPKSSHTVTLDPSRRDHQSIIAGRALHELVHGVFGINGHNENFAAVLTAVFSRVGGKLEEVINAIRCAVGAPSPIPTLTASPVDFELTHPPLAVSRSLAVPAKKPRRQHPDLFAAQGEFRMNGRRAATLNTPGLFNTQTAILDLPGVAAPLGRLPVRARPAGVSVPLEGHGGRVLTGKPRIAEDGKIVVRSKDHRTGRLVEIPIPAGATDWRVDLATPPRDLQGPLVPAPEAIGPGSVRRGVSIYPLGTRRDENGMPVGEAKMPTGESIEYGWRVAALGDLKISHDPWSLEPNKAYPQVLQPRDRSRSSYADQINRLVREFDPQLLTWSATAADGAPIVGPDMVVESGNGRTMALSRIYRDGGAKADAYKATILAWGEHLGLPDGQLERIKDFDQPVLVRLRLTDVDRAEFAREANVSGQQGMAAAEQAISDAAALTPALVGKLDPAADLSAAANQGFVSDYIEKVAGRQARGTMADLRGKLSLAGETRIRYALFAYAFGPASHSLLPEIAEFRDSDLTAFLRGMMMCAPTMARLQADIAEGIYDDGYAVGASVSEAAHFVAAARKDNAKVWTQYRQISTFPLGDAAHCWLFAGFPKGERTSGPTLTAALLRYALEVQQHPAGQLSFFDAPPSQLELIGRAVAEVIGEDDPPKGPGGSDIGKRLPAAVAAALPASWASVAAQVRQDDKPRSSNQLPEVPIAVDEQLHLEPEDSIPQDDATTAAIRKKALTFGRYGEPIIAALDRIALNRDKAGQALGLSWRQLFAAQLDAQEQRLNRGELSENVIPVLNSMAKRAEEGAAIFSLRSGSDEQPEPIEPPEVSAPPTPRGATASWARHWLDKGWVSPTAEELEKPARWVYKLVSRDDAKDAIKKNKPLDDLGFYGYIAENHPNGSITFTYIGQNGLFASATMSLSDERGPLFVIKALSNDYPHYIRRAVITFWLNDYPQADLGQAKKVIDAAASRYGADRLRDRIKEAEQEFEQIARPGSEEADYNADIDDYPGTVALLMGDLEGRISRDALRAILKAPAKSETVDAQADGSPPPTPRAPYREPAPIRVISAHTSRGGYRVRVFDMPADVGSLGRTISEEWPRTEASARKLVKQLANEYPKAIVQGIFDDLNRDHRQKESPPKSEAVDTEADASPQSTAVDAGALDFGNPAEFIVTAEKKLKHPYLGAVRTAVADPSTTAAMLVAEFDRFTDRLPAVKDALRVALKKSGLRSAEKIEKSLSHILEQIMFSFVPANDWISYPMPGRDQTWEDVKVEANRKGVRAQTDEMLATWRDKRAQAAADYADPLSLKHITLIFDANGAAALSTEQLAILDAARANQTRASREAAQARAASVRPVTSLEGATIVEGWHTKHNRALWVVVLPSRIDGDAYKALAQQAKQLGGTYQNNARFTGGKTPNGFNFDTAAGAERFATLVGGAAVSTEEDWQEAQESSRAAGAAHLRETAESMIDRARESLGRDRLTNTARRADMAAGVLADAQALLSLGRTTLRVAEAVEANNPALAGIRHVTQIAELRKTLRSAAWEWRRKNDDGRQADPPEVTDPKILNVVAYPWPTIWPGDLRRLASRMADTPGSKRLGAKFLKWSGGAGDQGSRKAILEESRMEFTSHDTIEELAEAARNFRAYGLTRWDVANVRESILGYMRLWSANIRNEFELREALRAFAALYAAPEGESQIAKATRDLIGRNIPGFYPTPRPVVDRMIAAAELAPDQAVLEPSAGKGDLAEAIREAEPQARLEVVEPVSSLREILKLKGFDLVADDFLAHAGKDYDRILMNPPFEAGADIDHVRHAFDMLKPGGRLVAIMSEGPFFRSDRKATEFRQWLESVDGHSEKLPAESFAGKDAFRQTGVATRLVTIQRPEVSP